MKRRSEDGEHNKALEFGIGLRCFFGSLMALTSGPQTKKRCYGFIVWGPEALIMIIIDDRNTKAARETEGSKVKLPLFVPSSFVAHTHLRCHLLLAANRSISPRPLDHISNLDQQHINILNLRKKGLARLTGQNRSQLLSFPALECLQSPE